MMLKIGYIKLLVLKILKLKFKINHRIKLIFLNVLNIFKKIKLLNNKTIPLILLSIILLRYQFLEIILIISKVLFKNQNKKLMVLINLLVPIIFQIKKIFKKLIKKLLIIKIDKITLLLMEKLLSF